MKKKTALFLAAAMVLLLSGRSFAESYVSLYAGGAFPENVDWRDNIGIGSAGTIDLDNTPAFGAKIGHWFNESRYPFLGIEVEANVHFPDWNSVTTTTAFGFPVIPTRVRVRADTTLVAGLFNVLLRYPRGPVRPYAGGGMGFAVWDIGDQSLATVGTFRSESDTAFAWDIIAGLDLRLKKRVSVFGEYKYLGSNFSFPDFIGMDIDYRASLVYAGLRLRF